ncbi:hypothetical protein NN561_010053 [Cricetulus griseus]
MLVGSWAVMPWEQLAWASVRTNLVQTGGRAGVNLRDAGAAQGALAAALATRHPPSDRWERATPCGHDWNCSLPSASLRKGPPDWSKLEGDLRAHTRASTKTDVPLIWAGSPCNHSTPRHRCNSPITLWNKRELVTGLPSEVGMECSSISGSWPSSAKVL